MKHPDYRGQLNSLLFMLEVLIIISSLKALAHLSSRNVDRLKSVQRIYESMKMYDL